MLKGEPMKRIAICVLLLALAGCSVPEKIPTERDEPPAQTDTVQQEKPEQEKPQQETPVQTEPKPESALPLKGPYVLQQGAEFKIIDAQGQILLQTSTGEASVLRENLDGDSKYLMVQRMDGRVEHEGWAMPERYWCEFYTLKGEFLRELPIRTAELQGDLVFGYNYQTETSQVYRMSDGVLLYDHVQQFCRLGQTVYLNEGDWDAPGVFVDGNGTVLAELPAGYTAEGARDAWMLVRDEMGLCGLLDETGRLAVACAYDWINQISGGYALAARGNMSSAVELRTGTPVFQVEGQILMVTPQSVIAGSDGNYRLLDLQGQPLMEPAFTYPSVLDEGHDGVVELITATSADETSLLCFRPDGTIVWQQARTEGVDSYLQPLSAHSALLSEYQYRENQDALNTVALLDLSSGTRKLLVKDEPGYCYPLYDWYGNQTGYLTRSSPNELGWNRISILDSSGAVVVEDLQSFSYQQDYVFQCSKGFRTGLMSLDGVWIYSESSFASVDAD